MTPTSTPAGLTVDSLIRRLRAYSVSMRTRMFQVQHLVSHKAYEEAATGVALIDEAIVELGRLQHPQQPATGASTPVSEGCNPMTKEQIKYLVDRFLGWKLPSNFSPDAGISFKAAFNEHMPHPMKHEPSGTNLFDAEQATAMVRYMIDGMPPASTVQAGEVGEIRKRHDEHSYKDGTLLWCDEKLECVDGLDQRQSLEFGKLAHKDRATLLRALSQRQTAPGVGLDREKLTNKIFTYTAMEYEDAQKLATAIIAAQAGLGEERG